MKPRFIPAALFSALLVMASLPAQAVGNLADVTITDRDTGANLPVYYARGEYWVAGRPGARYAVTVRNRLGERVLAVPSVDGVNVLSGETAAWDQRGYVFSPHERYQITGWRKSSAEVAAFEFSAAGDSYAGRTGRPGHVGVIGVALFREQQALPPRPPAYVYPNQSLRRESNREGDGDTVGQLREEPPPAPTAAPVPASPAGLGTRSLGQAGAPAEPATSREPESESAYRTAPAGSLAKAAPIQTPMPSPKLGTAHGQRETSFVRQTTFVRQQAQPNEIISIRYDSRENLIASGVIRETVRQPAPSPFPKSEVLSYVPDPPRY